MLFVIDLLASISSHETLLQDFFKTFPEFFFKNNEEISLVLSLLDNILCRNVKYELTEDLGGVHN